LRAAVGKTLVSSSMIDRVVQKLDRRLNEVPVGFKWFTPGLFDGSCCFGGEESAGASFLRFDGSVWTTDKDGPIMEESVGREDEGLADGVDLSPWIASRVRVILCPFFEGERHEAVPVLGRADRQQAASC